MNSTIIDGSGSGYAAKVDKNLRVHALAVSSTISQTSGISGDTYNINTGTIALTTASQTAVLYLKNNTDNDVYIDAIGFLLGNSTNGTGDVSLEVIKNPTTGTIITNAVSASIVENKNAGSSKVLDADVYKGVEGDTVTNGTDWYNSLLAGAARSYVIATGTIIIKSGNSVSINITPQTSNTAMNVQVFMSVVESNGSIS
jgi:hypothetical protein